jgi:RNA 2',3'-cyclic 3'-phosphodiesterase
LRLFAEAVIDEKTRAGAFSVLEALAKTGADYKWVERENLHVTLRFFGEVEDAKVPKVADLLKKAALAAAPFELEFSCLGAFDSLRRPKMLWLGLSKGKDELAALAAALGEEKPFKPHLTIGRQRSMKNMGALATLLSSYEVAPFGCRVEKIALVQSTLSGKGPTYNMLAASALGGDRFLELG